MPLVDVCSIFEAVKEEFLMGIPTDAIPVGVLLGGQGAVGKGQLNLWAEKIYDTHQFLAINGDNYRMWHPEFDALRKDIWTFSENTQQFSSVFTEGLIKEAFQRRLSFVVEGTMRSPETPIKTATAMRNHGYKSAAFAIAAPKEISLMNIFNRYFREVQNKGFGRMVDIASHNAAVDGLPESLDRLFHEKIVDRICVFDCFARTMVADYHLVDGGWNSKVLPSVVVLQTRERQLSETQLTDAILESAKRTIQGLTDERVKTFATEAYRQLTESV